ncbi:MAG: hypothetical protein KGJ43_04590 [Acidobacteriota bacterium]|nr:hypothetical protein [Acidobacteriota bacterium]
MTMHEMAERAIVLQLLRADHDHRWLRAELETALCDIAPMALDHALASLAEAGVAEVRGERVRATRCARRLDALGLIAV